MAETTEQRRGLDLSGLPEGDRAILNRVMWLEDRVADLEAALGTAYRQLSNVATVHDPQHNWRWTNIALDTLRGVTKGQQHDR